MRIVVASDSFKGSLSSREVGEAVLEVFPEDDVIVVPVADGGEGTVYEHLERILDFSTRQIGRVDALGGHRIEKWVQDPLGRPVLACYGWIPDRRLAVIETAAASGLTRLAPEERNPMETSTYGTGELVRDALEKGADGILLGLGGSATHDAGTGLLEALGWQFLDGKGHALKGCGRNLSRIEGSVHLGKLLGGDALTIPGGGSAGGIGATLHSLLRARIGRGIDLVLDLIGFDRKLDGADLVITGEGRIDAQTALGKVPAGVAERARRRGLPVIALCGRKDPSADTAPFDAVLSITPEGTPLETALRKDFAREHLQKTLRNFRDRLTAITKTKSRT